MEFGSDNCIHLIISVPHLILLMASFFLVHFVFDINCILDIINGSLTLVLLCEQPVDQISNLDFEARGELAVQAIKH